VDDLRTVALLRINGRRTFAILENKSDNALIGRLNITGFPLVPEEIGCS